jgi:hypothetical protein
MAAPTEPKRCVLTPPCLCGRWLPLIFQLVCCGARLNSHAPAFIPTNIKHTDMKSRFCRPVRSGAPGPSAVRSGAPGPSAVRSGAPGPSAVRSGAPGPSAVRSGAPESVLIGFFVGFVIIVARSHVTCVTERSGAASRRGTVRMRLRACAPVRLRAFTVNGPKKEQAIIPRAGLPDRPARAHAPGYLLCVGIRVRRIPCASSYYKSRADWNPSAAGKLADWNPSRLISRADWNPIAICKLPNWIMVRSQLGKTIASVSSYWAL